MQRRAKPIFLLHRSYRGGAEFRELATAVAEAAGDRLEVGALVTLPKHDADAASVILDEADCELRIVDPAFHEHEAFGGQPTRTQLHRAPYLAGTLPRRPTDAIVDAVLEAQRAAGATALLTPTGEVTLTDAERSLADSMQWVRAARAKGPAEPMLVGLTLHRAWLSDAKLREVLLNEIVDSTERNWYLRVRWPSLRPRHGQLMDAGLLAGYVHLVEVLASERKVLLLPQTGPTGWLMTALGAGGFAVGTGGPEQAYADQVHIRIKGPRRPPLPRYFEPSILHTVTGATQGRLARAPGYAECGCRYCARMRSAGAAIDPARWDADTAARHMVVTLARLASGLGAVDRRRAGRDLVDAAQATANRATPPLTGEDRPTHLGIWRDLLAP